MSRARPFYIDETETIWFDLKDQATPAQLELLAEYEQISIDDLLDEGLSQRQVLTRLRIASDQYPIPPEVIERRRQRYIATHNPARCRICTLEGWVCEGSITRHHFIPRWLMRELPNYRSYSSRSICTVPICIGRHADLHRRCKGRKSVVKYLRVHERRLAQAMMDDLKDERPHLYTLLESGDEHYAYEAQLVYDHSKGHFRSSQDCYTLDEYETALVA